MSAGSAERPARRLTVGRHWQPCSVRFVAGPVRHGERVEPLTEKRRPMARVGLCEDDSAIRRVVNDAMRMAGHEVVNAHDGGEAIRQFVDDDAGRDHPRHRAAGRRRSRRLPGAALGRTAGAGPVPDRARCGARAAGRLQRRRRRLPAQAVRRARADRPGRGAGQARPARGRRGPHGPGPRPGPALGGRATARSRCSPRPSSGCSPRSPRARARSCAAGPSWPPRGRTAGWSATTPSTPTSGGSG